MSKRIQTGVGTGCDLNFGTNVGTSCVEAATICPRPCELTFDLLTLKVVSEPRVMWATSVPILAFLGLCVLDLDPMYATDKQTSDAHHRLMPQP